jgi:hypothetical protein
MVDQVEVDDAKIRIVGRRTVLERLVMGGGAGPVTVAENPRVITGEWGRSWFWQQKGA